MGSVTCPMVSLVRRGMALPGQSKDQYIRVNNLTLNKIIGSSNLTIYGTEF